MTELTRVVPEYGVRQVYNGTGGTLLQGSCVKLKAAPTYKNEIEAATADTDATLGVLMADAVNLKTADCQITGRAIVLSGGIIAVGARVMAIAAGVVDTATATHSVLGIAVTAGAVGELMEVELTGPGGAAMPT